MNGENEETKKNAPNARLFSFCSPAGHGGAWEAKPWWTGDARVAPAEAALLRADRGALGAELARLDCSKNAGVQNDPKAKEVLTAAAAKRGPTAKYGAFTLLIKDEPGQKWSPEGFHDVVKWV